jgi:hypothetical protein
MSDDGDLKSKVQGKLAELKTLRDEIRVHLQLASMELRDEWQKIESRLPDPSTMADDLKEKAADLKQRASGGAAELSDKAIDVLTRLTKELEEFRERVRARREG